ncbi:MAG: four helix bundle protein [Planctomycetes bacterium]|nr:four helix bundle protein [Planctomycetota bacterium]
MDNKEFARELENRTRKFAVRIIQLSRTLPNTPESKVIKTQITKSGTSIGANYREANRARSKADFRNKIKICESEASETQYWLEIIVKLNWLSWKKLNGNMKNAVNCLVFLHPLRTNNSKSKPKFKTLYNFTLYTLHFTL